MGYLVKIIFCGLLGLFSCSSLLGQGVWEVLTPHLDLEKVVANEHEESAVFLLKNVGKHPILIHRVTPMSPLLKAVWSKKPILPGQTVDIQINFTSSQLAYSNFDHKITVFSNAQNNRLELKLSGCLTDNPEKPELLFKQEIDGLRFRSKHVSLGNIYSWQSKDDTIHFINKRPEVVRLGAFRPPSYIEPIFIPSEVKSGEKGAIILRFHGPKKKEYGYNYEPLFFTVNDEVNMSYFLYISSTLTEDFSSLTTQELADAPIAFFKQKEVDFGEINEGKKKSCLFTLTNNGNSPLYIRTTKASCGCTAVKRPTRAINPKETITLQIIFDSTGKLGYQNKTITVITNDPKNPETVLRIKGKVQ